MLSGGSSYATTVSLMWMVAEDSPVYPSQGSPAAPLELDASELHRRIVGFQRLTDRFRLELLKLLAIFDDGHRYLELGYSSTKHYLVQELAVGRTNALELVRVARRLGELPRLAAALGDGEIRWSALKVLSRVATAATEAEWLDFARTHTHEQIEHEVNRAIAEGRDRPADESEYGLTNIRSRISFELTLEEKERFQTAMARVAESMGEGAPTDLASVLTFISQRILEGQPVVEGPAVHNVDDPSVHNVDATASRGRAALTVVYHKYTEDVSTVDTPDGPVRVDADVIDRIEDVAEKVTLTASDVAEAAPLAAGEIDRPNTDALARKVRKRDGDRCANPGCGSRRGLMAHHIRFRAAGGRTVIQNEVAVCRLCHSLVHAGLLAIERGAAGELRWVPLVRTAPAVEAIDPLDLFPKLADLTAGSLARPAAPRAAPSIDREALVDGLTSLGYTKRAARQQVHRALDELGGSDRAIDEAAVLRQALRGHHAGLDGSLG